MIDKTPELFPVGDIIVKEIKHGVVNVSDTIIVKYFEDKQAFTFENLSFSIAKSLSLPIPRYLFTHDNYLIGMSYVGKSIKDHVISGYDPYEAGVLVGSLMKYYQGKVATQGTKENILSNRKIKTIMNSCLVSSGLIYNYANNPGSLGYCHGDASINNFTIVQPDKVHMIDFSGLTKMGAFGIPAYEYYQFLTSIFQINSLSIQNKLTAGFIDGYGETNFTDEANILFQTYWSAIRNNKL